MIYVEVANTIGLHKDPSIAASSQMQSKIPYVREIVTDALSINIINTVLRVPLRSYLRAAPYKW